MLSSSILTTIFLPLILIGSSIFFLISIWSTKTFIRSLVVELDRGKEELEMVIAQGEFCQKVKTEKEKEIEEKTKQEEALRKILMKVKNK